MDSNQPQFQLQSDLSPYHRQQRTRAYRFSRAWGVNKIVLTSVSVACCAIVLGISITLAADIAIKSYIVVWTAPQAGVSLVWSGVELITACVGRESQRSIHPGANVAVHLLLWLGFAVAVGLTAYILDFALDFVRSNGRDANSNYYNHDDEGGYEYYSDYYIRSMEALVAFLAFLTFVHISLFLGACMETVRCRRMRSAPRHPDYPMEPLHSARLPKIDEEKKETRHGAT
ncbi:hypothetical protein F5Y13DRAFT_144763 [Hypoxylon sp. FL1857]|nr:hypothetical protein F5Y13DRAFT_144763 [Hypoxylon sp. FL1857]